MSAFRSDTARVGVAIGLAALSANCARPSTLASVSTSIVRTEQTSGTTALLIAVSPVNERVVWVSGSQGTWLRTLDGGATWESGRVSGADSLQFRDVHAVDASTAYLLSIGSGSQSRIYKTTDAGQHWSLPFMNRDSAGFYDCMDFWDANRGIVIGDAVAGQIAMLMTTDGGAHWNRVPPSSLPAAQPQEGSFAASGTCVVTRPGGRAWIVASNASHGRVLHTMDYGRTWGGVYVPGTRQPTIVAVGPAGAVFTRDDGSTWTTIDTLNYWSVGFASPRAGWAVGARGRITKLSF